MAEQTTPVAEQTAAPKKEKKRKAPATHEQRQKRRKLVGRITGVLITLAVIAAAVFLLRKYVFKGSGSDLGQPMTQEVYRGSIISMVQGMGNARAKNAAVITPESGYTVLDLLVAEGDVVEVDQPLYDLDDSKAQEALRTAQADVLTAQENVRKAQELVTQDERDLESLYADVDKLSIRAPHAGKLTEVNKDIKVGDDLSAGTAVATVINDTKMRLSLYYSWAYEGVIAEGQSARITLPVSMSEYPAAVEKINYVRRVVPEGSITFEVVFVMDNPGTLTAGMAASAVLSAADGSAVYPYESGKLEYYETTKVEVRQAGPVELVSLMNYADVTPSQELVRLGDESLQKKISDKRDTLRADQKTVEERIKAVDSAKKAVEEAEKKLQNYHAVSPIYGKVISLGGLAAGENVPGNASIQIADTSTMLVDISVDERNISYVTPGMMVDLKDQMENYYMGTVETVALSAKAENGVATFPATVSVENPEGTLMTNAYVNYSFITSQSNDCLVVPVQAVKNVSMGAAGEDMDFGGGSTQGPGAFNTSGAATVCFVQGPGDERALEPQDSWQIPDGFFAVKVTTGLSDEQNAEITSGLHEGDVVFYGYLTDTASSWNW